MAKPTSLRCTAMDVNNVQCAMMVKIRKLLAGQPILCHLHQPGSTSFQATEDPRQVLRQLMKSRDQSIQLRSSVEWLELMRKDREESAKGQSDAATAIDDLMRRATPPQLEELRGLVTRARELKTAIATQDYQRGTWEQERDAAEKRQTLVMAALPTPEPVTPDLAPEMIPPQARVEPSVPVMEPSRTLAREKWTAAGIYEERVAIDGVVTTVVSHAEGDDYAAQVIAGEIPYAEAVEREQRRVRQTKSYLASLKE